MAAPVIQSVSTIVSGSTSSGLTLNAPSGVVAGDFLLAVVCSQNGQKTNTPTGWTLATFVEVTALSITVFYRVADGGADDTPTVTHPNSSGATTARGYIVRINGQKASGAFDFAANTPSPQFDSSVAIPTGTVAENDSLCVAFAANSAASTVSWSAGWVESSDQSNIAVASRSSAAGASPAGTATFTASGRVEAVTVVVKPAAGGASGYRRRRGWAGGFSSLWQGGLAG